MTVALVLALLAALVVGYLISLIWKQSSPKLTIDPVTNPNGRMQLWKAVFLLFYLVLFTGLTAYAIYSLWDWQPPTAANAAAAGQGGATGTATPAASANTQGGSGTATPPANTKAGQTGTTPPANTPPGNTQTGTAGSALPANTPPGKTQPGTAGSAPPPNTQGENATAPATGSAAKTPAGSQTVPGKVQWSIFNWHPEITGEVRLILLVLFTGAFGSCVYSLKSFADFLGIKELYESWFTFYVVQPWEGAGIAFLFYLVLRGGLMAGNGGGDNAGGPATPPVNPYGVTAMAALAGAFSDKALAKLRDVADAVFAAKDTRTDKGIGLKITTASPLPNADHTALAPYHVALQAGGGTAPYTWSALAPFPAWLTLTNDGNLGGTPPNPGPNPLDLTLRIKVTDATGATATQNYTLRVV
jgi:hypothetical protein